MDIQIQPHEEEEEREIVVPSRELVVPDREIVPSSASDEIVRPMVVDGVAQCWTNGGAGNPAALLSSGQKLYEGDPKTRAYVWTEYPTDPGFTVNMISNNLARLNWCVSYNEHYAGSYGKAKNYRLEYAREIDDFFKANDVSTYFTTYPQYTNVSGPTAVSVSADKSKFPELGKKVPVGYSEDILKMRVNVGVCFSTNNYANYCTNSGYTGTLEYIEAKNYNLHFRFRYSGTTHITYGMYKKISGVDVGTEIYNTRNIGQARYSDNEKKIRWVEIALQTSFGTFKIQLQNVPDPPGYNSGIIYPFREYSTWHNIEFVIDLSARTVDMTILRKNFNRKMTVFSTDVTSWRYDDTR